MFRLLSRFLRALFQFSKRAAGKATKFGRSGVKLLGVVGAARLECGEPAAESGELIRRQLGNSFGDFFDFHGAPTLSTAWTGCRLRRGFPLGASIWPLAFAAINDAGAAAFGAGPHVESVSDVAATAIVTDHAWPQNLDSV